MFTQLSCRIESFFCFGNFLFQFFRPLMNFPPLLKSSDFELLDRYRFRIHTRFLTSVSIHSLSAFKTFSVLWGIMLRTWNSRMAK